MDGQPSAHDPVLEQFAPHEHFCRVMLDPYAVINASGRVVKCNQAFSQLVGMPGRQVLAARSLDDLLTLVVDNTELKAEQILRFDYPTRFDEIGGRTRVAQDLMLIVGIYPFNAPDRSRCLGSFVLIRDVTAERGLQNKYHSTHKRSITDPLTGLYTRVYFEEYLTSQLSRRDNMSPDSPLKDVSVAMLDIDFFKRINDNFGHQAGDHVLRIVAETLLKIYRKTDIVCRFGGEEFLVIMPGTDLVGAGTAAEKARAAVEALDIRFEGRSIPVTLSSGIAQIDYVKETHEGAIARADAALYSSKRGGRNRVTLHDGRDLVEPGKISSHGS